MLSGMCPDMCMSGACLDMCIGIICQGLSPRSSSTRCCYTDGRTCRCQGPAGQRHNTFLMWIDRMHTHTQRRCACLCTGPPPPPPPMKKGPPPPPPPGGKKPAGVLTADLRMHAHMHTHAYTSTCACVCVRVCAQVQSCTLPGGDAVQVPRRRQWHVHTCTHLHTRAHAHTHMHARMHACTHANMHVRTDAGMYMHAHAQAPLKPGAKTCRLCKKILPPGVYGLLLSKVQAVAVLQ